MFKQPSTKYGDFYDQARFSLIWNISISIFVSMVVFSASLVFLAPAYLPPSVFALLTAFIFIVILKKTRKHVLVAKLFVISIPYIGLKTIVPLVLLYNELVSNSLKHAFEKDGEGKITFIGTQGEDGTLLINYKDDGKWKLDASISSFGIELIQMFTEQLEGSYERMIDSGTQYVFHLKNLD